jgi:alpha-tubulin suppressor-like RCC1 family protein
MGTIDTDPYHPNPSIELWRYVTVPTQIVRVTDAVDIEIGNNNWFVRTGDGHLWVWGLNWDYVLGDGTNEWRPIPIVLPGIEDVVHFEAHVDHHSYSSFALKSDGTVWAWGSNSSGDLGDGTGITRREPSQVPRVDNIVKLKAVNGSVYALDSGGTLWFWQPGGGLSYIGYDYGLPYLRPIPITHVEGVGDFAGANGRLYVWAN